MSALEKDYDVDARGVAHVIGGCQCDRRGSSDTYRCTGCGRLWGWCIGGHPDERCDECTSGCDTK